MFMRKSVLLLAVITSLAGVASVPAVASEIVYHPVNPTFGGNPLNGSALLSQAQAQGVGVKSGSQGVDLSGLDAALSNLGNSTGNSSNGTGNGNSGSGTSGTQTNTVRSTVP
jgi:curli production assembly/transport component CsgF